MNLLLCFLAVGILGLRLGMDHNQNGTMKGCVFMMQQGDSAVCSMSAAEHLLQWQQFLLAEPKSDQHILLTALALTVILPVLLALPTRALSKTPDFKLQRWRARIMKLFDYLLQALSQGILRPKVF